MSGELPDLPGVDGLDVLRYGQSGPLVPLPIPFGGDPGSLSFWVDPVAGDGANLGTLEQPLKTYRYGVSPRLDGRVLQESVNIFQMGDVPPDDVYWALTYQGFAPLNEFGFLESSTVRFQGINHPVLIGPSTVTGAIASATSTRGQVTIAGANFTGLEHMRLRVVSGPREGLITWVQAVVSPTTVWVSPGLNVNGFASQSIAVGDVVVVEDMHSGPLLAGRHQPSTSNYAFFLFGLKWVDDAEVFRFFDPGPWSILESCRVAPSWFMATIWTDVYGCDIATGTGNSLLITGRMTLENCNLAIRQQTGGYLQTARCSQAGARFAIVNGVWVPTNYMQFWDWPSLSAIEVLAGGSVNASGVVSGTSAAAGTYGIRVRGGSSYVYSAAGSKPTVAGAAAFAVEVGGTTFTYAQVPASSQVPARMAGIVLA